MHETSIVQALLEQVESQARAHKATSVQKVTLRLGELAGVEAELLATAFDVYREPTVAKGAALEIVRVPARYRCPQCSREVHRGDFLQCPDCAVGARLIAGDEIVLERLEMEVD
ncbi:MAG TPA: hydrogenase maturation nickel metallochaperone HypA [Candidatus Polarisedimenticolaceae bacterium]|jgi:hydrogenase nickel incorporation protein HypA/HybF